MYATELRRIEYTSRSSCFPAHLNIRIMNIFSKSCHTSTLEAILFYRIEFVHINIRKYLVIFFCFCLLNSTS